MHGGDVQERATAPVEDAELEAAVDRIVAAWDGDARAAVRALLIANADLNAKAERLVEAASFGFSYGRSRRALVDRQDVMQISDPCPLTPEQSDHRDCS